MSRWHGFDAIGPSFKTWDAEFHAWVADTVRLYRQLTMLGFSLGDAHDLAFGLPYHRDDR